MLTNPISIRKGKPALSLLNKPPFVSLNTQKTVQKRLSDPDNHDGVITNLEPDILECKVKWALGGGDGIPAELF